MVDASLDSILITLNRSSPRLTDEESAVEVARFNLIDRSPILRELVPSLAFLHWFDEPVVQCLLPVTDRYNSQKLYEELSQISFIDSVQYGLALNHSTRKGLLARATADQRIAASRAVDAYRIRQTTESLVESVYCLVLGQNRRVAKDVLEKGLFDLTRSEDWIGILALFQAVDEAEYYVQKAVLTYSKLHLSVRNLATRQLHSKKKVLYISANPLDAEQLNLAKEDRAIEIALQSSILRDDFVLIKKPSVRDHELIPFFVKHKPTIVHFSGHGSETGQIIVEDENGYGVPISSETLGDVFEILNRDTNQTRCVVLNTCFSEHLAQCILKYVDVVIGVSKDITDDAAVRFASAFYAALVEKNDIHTAFELGCASVNLPEDGGKHSPKYGSSFHIFYREGINPKYYIR